MQKHITISLMFPLVYFPTNTTEVFPLVYTFIRIHCFFFFIVMSLGSYGNSKLFILVYISKRPKNDECFFHILINHLYFLVVVIDYWGLNS